MVCGEKGNGKTNFIESFMRSFDQPQADKVIQSYLEHKKLPGKHLNFPTKKLTEFPMRCKESGFKLRMIDTPGHGESAEISEWLENLQNYLVSKLLTYSNE